MVRIGDLVHTLTFAYLCVYAAITDSVVPSILHRNKYDETFAGEDGDTNDLSINDTYRH